MSTQADDLHGLIEHPDLRDVVLVGHSSCVGEVTRYDGTARARAAKAVPVGVIPPLMLKTEPRPEVVARNASLQV
jgi:non-heme chloroperoxidase